METEQALVPVEEQVIEPLPPIVQRFLDGETIEGIAREDKRCARTIYKYILSKVGNNYKDLVTEALINRIADADLELDKSTDKVAVARAREKCRLTRMDFERRRPELYGTQTGQATANIQVNITR